MSSIFMNPRSLISSCNVDTLLLKSLLPETRLTFVNSGTGAPTYSFTIDPTLSKRNLITQTIPGTGSPYYVLSSSNQQFTVYQNTDTLATFQEINGIPNFQVPGTITASNFTVIPNGNSRKGVVLQDFNAMSVHQFAGIGYNNGALNLQIPSINSKHTFSAASSTSYSVELMRLQNNSLGRPQLGIGTSVFASNVALQVAGNVSIQGSLTVTNGLYGFVDTSEFIRFDSNTGRISSNLLPNNLLFLNTNNQIDNSVLPIGYNYQYLKANKNIGIGTKTPAQKLHVQGGVCITDRIGIGTLYPSSRIHAIESSGTFPTATLINNSGGDILQSFLSGGIPAMFISGTHAGVGIGTSSVDIVNALQVNGNAYFSGGVTCCNINLRYVAGETIDITNSIYGPVLRVDTITLLDGTQNLALTASVPFNCYQGITTNTIECAQSSGFVTLKNSSLHIDGDLTLTYPPTINSDKRLKSDITIIENALDKIDKIYGYQFKYNVGFRDSAGVIAQEIMEILPQAVQIGKGGYYGVQYDAIIALLIQAIRELKEKIK